MTATMLLCCDGSRASLAAARHAIELARALTSDILAVYVIAEDASGSIDVITPGHPPAVERLGQSGTAALEFIKGLATGAAVPLETRLLEGDPAELILQTAATSHPSLIVIGRTGRHGPGSALLGSVTARILEFAEVPVLVVPAE